MSGLFGNLSSGIKALTAHSRSVETAGRNLANVNNANYARQRVVYGDRGTILTPLGAQSLGLEAKGIVQLRDGLLDRSVVHELSLKAQYETEQASYQKAQAGLGQSIDRAGESGASGEAGTGNGIAESMSDFFMAFQSFASRPTDPGERQSLLQKAAILTDRFQLTDSRLAQVQADITTQVTSDVADANRILSAIAELNTQIGRFEIGAPGSAVDLRDQRQAQVEELAKKLSVETRPHATAAGQIEVFARDGSGNPVVLVSSSTVHNVTFSGSTVQGGSPATTLALTGGSIDGGITARDGGVQTIRTRLDALARQMVTAVNGAYNPTSSTGNFFNSANITAATISLQPGLTAASLKASDGGAAGDSTIATAVANLVTTVFSTGSGNFIDGSFSQFYNRAVTDLGQSLASTNSRLEDQTNIERLVRTQRDGLSGVSLDEEMADLMKYQRAFQASSRVIQVIDDLLDVVVNRLVR